MTPPTRNDQLAAAMTAILEYMRERDSEQRMIAEQVKVIPEIVTNLAVISTTVADLKKGQDEHEAILHGERDEPGLVGKFTEVKNDIGRMNGYVKAAIVTVMGSGLIMLAQLFLQHGTTLKP